MHVILCSASNFNFNFIIPSFIQYKLSKAKAGGLYQPVVKMTDNMLCRNEDTEG